MTLTRAALSSSRHLMRAGARRGARRDYVTTPMQGDRDAMRKEAVKQLQERIAQQKQVVENQGHKSHAEEVEEMWTWIKLSLYVAVPVCLVSAAKDLVMEHPHEKGLDVDYMKIRNKPFPWECDDCSLFDNKCWAACRAEKAAEGA